MVHLQRQERRPGAQHADHHRQQRQIALAHQHHHRVGAGAGRDQRRRQAPCARIEFAVAQGRVAAHRRDPLRMGRGPLREQAGVGTIERERRLAAVPVLQQQAPFLFAQHRQAAHRAGRIGHDRVEQADEMIRHARYGRLVEQVRVVFEGAHQAVRPFRQVQRQVELGAHAFGPQTLHRQSRQRQRSHRRVLQRQHHLEQRRVAQVAFRVEHIDQLLERHVLVRVGVQRVAAHPLEQLQEVGAVINLRAQHQRVDEEADQPFGLGAVAVGDRRADADVVLARITRQQHIERRRQCHEQGALRLAAQRVERRRGGGRQREALHRAAMALLRRTRTVRRQCQQGRRAAQLPLPVVQLPLQHFAAEPLALPVREVGVLDRQFRQRRWPLLHIRRVQRRHFLHQDAGRPAVRDDVVHRQQHDMLGLGQAQQARPDQRAVGQVERRLRLVLHQPLRLGLALRLRQVRQVLRFQRQFQHRRDHLHRRAVHAAEAGAQRLVPAHDLVDRAPQGRHVQRADQAYRQRNVIKPAARLQLVDEPQALLRERQRHGRVAADRHHRRRQQATQHRIQLRHQSGDGRRFEHRPQRQFDFERAADLRHQLRRQQRVAAQREEVVVQTYFVKLEHTGPDAGHDLLGRRARRHITIFAARQFRHRQRLAVHLAVRRERHLLQHHEVRRHHVFRQRLQQRRAQACSVGQLLAIVRDQIRDQAFVARHVLARQHQRFAHRFQRRQRGFDFTELDTEAAQLDLVVDTAQVFDAAVFKVARQVARLVQAAAGRAERVRNEAVGRQVAPVQVTPRQACAGDMQLTSHAHRHRFETRIQDI
ncbi:hypothetical protein DUGA6_62980 [Duganella sp. HH105]|nr:hypothetical protein DUGA6_62980 [Duganella sp. HH105]